MASPSVLWLILCSLSTLPLSPEIDSHVLQSDVLGIFVTSPPPFLLFNESLNDPSMIPVQTHIASRAVRCRAVLIPFTVTLGDPWKYLCSSNVKYRIIHLNVFETLQHSLPFDCRETNMCLVLKRHQALTFFLLSYFP